MRVLVTGASGFCGTPVVKALAHAGHDVIAAVRAGSRAPAYAHETRLLPDLASFGFDAARLVADVDAIVHMAGLAHATAAIADGVYWAVNADAAGVIAQAGRAAGVRHFVFVSSVRAQTGPSAGTILTERDAPMPADAYGRAKLAGEVAVRNAFAGSDVGPVVLRPVLMYGAGAKGNMAALMRLAGSRWPLPLGGLKARRSVLAVENFADAIRHVLGAPQAAGGTYLVADGGPAVSVPDIVAALRAGLGRPPGLVHVPTPGVVRLLALAGGADLSRRLFGDLVISTQALRATGWQPPHKTNEALAAAIALTAAAAAARGDTPL